MEASEYKEEGQAALDATDAAWYDACFRQKRRHGKTRLVAPPTPRLEAPVADTHAHLDNFKDPGLELARCAAWGLGFVCTVADPAEQNYLRTFDELDSWQQSAKELLPHVLEETRQQYAADERAEIQNVTQLICSSDAPMVRIAAGCHPHNARDFDDAMERELRRLLADPRVSAIGEVGLDYHYDNSPRDVQRSVFRRQIQLAHETELPLVLHLRSAHEEAFDILTQEGFPASGVLLHCFALGKDKADPWINAGCYLALGGAVSFKRFDPLRETAAHIPLNQLVTETDSPYMTPEPMRGMDCTPAHTIFTAETIAEARSQMPGSDRREMLEQIYANALGLLNRPPTAWQREHANLGQAVPSSSPHIKKRDL